ncbi:MAG: restriction endonuclease subunit S [Bacillus sp. (in: Bacteria)]|nr:restriction endonuclease subunit S [Bacillus sp. (in: firmicutes)]MCM1427577.1 restriction endonuclease subunit S [Eubacterium sp.]
MARQMKDSGVEWIGEIPEGWEVRKLKYLLECPMQYGANESGIEYDEDLPRYIRITDIDGNNNLKIVNKLSLTEQMAKNYILNDNDILFARSGATVGKTFLYRLEYGRSAFAGYLIRAILNREEAIPKFVYYYTLSAGYDLWKNYIFIQSTIQNIGADKYMNLSIPITKIDEQRKVIDFLDKKVEEIDSVIAKTKETIEDYKKYKQAIITDAVTKGLNPDVEMKETDSEWIGKIPVHWDYVRIQRLFEIVDERNNNPNACLLSLYTSLGVKPRSELEERGNKAATVLNYKIVKKDDVIVNKLLAWMGAIGYSDYEGVTSPDYDVYRAKEDTLVVKTYYNEYFRHTCFNGDCYKYGHGIMLTRWRTYPEELLRIKVPNPPLEEQREIARYLDEKSSEIDKLIAKKEKLLADLENYKKSLIYEYVTGKKEVIL